MTNNVWYQQKVTLTAKSRGFHLITDDIMSAVPQIRDIEIGLMHVFLQHTSASLCINENADPTVRQDLEAHVNVLAPENAPYYRHTYEGPDDMPAHIKTALLGNQLTLPVGQGKLLLGTWQGIYLGEHRNHSSARTLLVTLHGQGYT
ncbi:secondary thiamine-phosphate synthase enzyme YjbQ [Aestuariibacter salexigens]|uniref:secondary thiamine-phosphate synthase enzyme YjbQ n=1 Tax=Aestuariibacter salexigens TaxID=226010 RepID=UPI000416E5DA|nr:secondary thiamine-phosphate synthase enzyme YjbQ [Aestuariibacter salexigens]